MAIEKLKELNELNAAVNTLLDRVNLSDVDPNVDFEGLPDGYYLSEVTKAELTVSKSTNRPMVAMQFKVVEDGKALEIDEDGNANLAPVKSKGRMLFIYYVLKDESSVKRFVKDMLKFEGEVAGEPLLAKEYFAEAELLNDALDILIGTHIYVQVSTSKNAAGESSTWQNLISWRRVDALDLPM